MNVVISKNKSEARSSSKVWDTEMGGLKSEIVGNKAFFSLSYSEDNRSLLATGADRSIRLYDPRATEGNLVTAHFSSLSRVKIILKGSKCVHLSYWVVLSGPVG